MAKNIVTQEELKRKFSYNSKTGLFTRLKKMGNFKAGSIVVIKPHHSGYLYLRMTLDSGEVKSFSLHRLAWLYENGILPEFIDHLNHNRSDNRILNLRSVTRQDNNMNQTLSKHNTSGVMGVSWHKRQQKWCAGIKVKYKKIYLGSFDDKNDAILARKEAELKYGFHDNHGS